ncbi:MAG: hypothetical protein ACM3JG_19010 [Thiohalocapsa sp.]
MKGISFVLTGLAVVAMAGSALAHPVKLSKEQLATVTAGSITTTITTTQLNGGGNTPNGVANGVPIVTTSISTNPAGSAPPGQNK